MAAYRSRGRISVADTAERLREVLVADWWEGHRQGGDALMIAARRRDAEDLSRRARGLLLAAGTLSGPSLNLPAGEVAQGDRVMALRNHWALGVHNGLRATVTAVNLEAVSVDVQTDDARRLTLPRHYLEAGHLVHAYAVTAHKAQGLSVERA